MRQCRRMSGFGPTLEDAHRAIRLQDDGIHVGKIPGSGRRSFADIGERDVMVSKLTRRSEGRASGVPSQAGDPGSGRPQRQEYLILGDPLPHEGLLQEPALVHDKGRLALDMRYSWRCGRPEPGILPTWMPSSWRRMAR
jgi:hypothetical protein